MNRWKRKKIPLVLSALVGTSLISASPGVLAVTSYLNDFNVLYGTGGSVLDSCLVCHVSDPNTGGSARNVYGGDFGIAKISSNGDVQAALIAIELDDSDLDGIDNITEIDANPDRTFPGDCTDPDPAGCGGGGIPPEPPPGTITEGPTLTGCYKWSRYPDERFALSIKRYGGLVTTEPRIDFIESQNQTNHGVHGKHVGLCGPGTIGAVGGTFLKAKDIGSKIGLRTMAVRGDGAFMGMDTCREVVIDCISEEDVQLPKEFECRSRNEFDVYHGKSEMKLVQNSTADELCQAFDGYSATHSGDGSASGLRDNGGDGNKERRGKEDRHDDH